MGHCIWNYCLAAFVGSFIVGSKNKRLLKASEQVNEENVINALVKEKDPKPLPDNKWPAPFVPEILIRILAIVAALVSSIGLYRIFQSIVGLDIIGVVNDVQFKSQISTFTTLAVMLVFFTKLDIRQSFKNSFRVNYILFFAGLIFYILLIFVQAELGSYKGDISVTVTDALNYLPGNIIWGILAFNLLVTFLFAEPQSIQNSSKKRIRYRCFAILPILYLIASSVINIGSRSLGWNIPFAINSLFFSKALILTVFSVLYCFGVYFYKRHTIVKYGKENSIIYRNGNAYLYKKNLIVVAIVALLGVVSIIISKYWPENPFDAAGGYIILFTIPFILFYHPHFGQRNKKWDIAFGAIYGLSMALGILLIAGSIGEFITSI